MSKFGKGFRVLFYNPETIDCTSDPHPVSYDAVDEMLEAVLKVCKSDLVYAVRSVRLEFGDPDNGGEEFKSDWYSTHDGFQEGTRKRAEGRFAREHKTEGLYFEPGFSDAKVDAKHHLPPGLTGIREAIKLIHKRGCNFTKLVVGVVWRFAMDSSCSDYITVDPAEMEVDFSNQDWWIREEGYEEHCAKLSELLGKEIEPNEDY